MANIIGATGFEGVIQKYLDSRWFDLRMRTFETPLANSQLGAAATIPNRNGQSIEFRKFSDFGVAQEFDQDSEPAADEAFKTVSIEVPLKELSAKTDLGNLLRKTDRSDLVRKAFNLLMRGLRRGTHQTTQNSLVIGISDTGLFDGTGNFTVAPLGTVFAGGVDNFSALTEDSLFRMEDFTELRTRHQVDGVPPAFEDGTYACVISHAIQSQLIQDDPDFREVVKHDPEQNKEIIRGAMIRKYNGITWILQHDEYKAQLPSAGGALATRDDGGRVHVAHFLGKEAYAYVDLTSDKKARMNSRPQWKVQDISVTGIKMTIGYRVPFRAAVIDADYGLNIAGTTKFFKGVKG